MLGVSKDVSVNANLDILKLIEKTADEVIGLTISSFYSNGAMCDKVAERNLHNIRGSMQVLKALVNSTK